MDGASELKTNGNMDDMYTISEVHSNQIYQQNHHNQLIKPKHHQRLTHNNNRNHHQQQLQPHQQLHYQQQSNNNPYQNGRIYPYKVETFQHFGTITCNAHNTIGQSGPCYYQLMAAEIPDSVRNCTSYNATANSIQINCIAGKDGGIQQYFHIEIIEDNRRTLLYNITFIESDFILKRLPSDTIFTIKVTAYNLQGSSTPYKLRVKTLPAPLLRTGKFNKKKKISVCSFHYKSQKI